jgi:FKBP-type peptidyl-prolyl cis-trans isomerase
MCAHSVVARGAVSTTHGVVGRRQPFARRASSTRGRVLVARSSAKDNDQEARRVEDCRAGETVDRRRVVVTAALATVFAFSSSSSSSSSSSPKGMNAYAAEDASDVGVRTVRDETGFGSKEARAPRDLVLVEYQGTLSDGTVFDTTLGGMVFATNSAGVGSVSIDKAAKRPAVIRLDVGNPVPGVPPGLIKGIEGMRVGGKRTFEVPPELGFGSSAVRSPYATVPADSTLTYEVTLLRLSSTGPDALFKGVFRCGLGGANTINDECGQIEPSE